MSLMALQHAHVDHFLALFSLGFLELCITRVFDCFAAVAYILKQILILL